VGEEIFRRREIGHRHGLLPGASHLDSVLYPGRVCDECQSTRDRNAIYAYLDAVYGLVGG
jgi:hypothetical protein